MNVLEQLQQQIAELQAQIAKLARPVNKTLCILSTLSTGKVRRKYFDSPIEARQWAARLQNNGVFCVEMYFPGEH